MLTAIFESIVVSPSVVQNLNRLLDAMHHLNINLIINLPEHTEA